jgi:hypothetical protein
MHFDVHRVGRAQSIELLHGEVAVGVVHLVKIVHHGRFSAPASLPCGAPMAALLCLLRGDAPHHQGLQAGFKAHAR